MTDPRVQKMANVIVNYSTKLKAGERALFRGTSPLATPLLQALYEEALKVGGLPSCYAHLSGESRILLSNGTETQIETTDPMLRLMYETADVIVRVEAEEDTHALAGFPTEKQQAYARRLNGLMVLQFEREGKKTLRRCTTLFPTEAYARDAGMTFADYQSFVYDACMLHLADPVVFWRDMAAQQQKYCDFLKGHKKLHVRGKNIDMELGIEGRAFVNADGTTNFPDGEIFTGPVEDNVNGWVRFTFPAHYNGNVVKGIELHFEGGKVVKATAKENEKFLLAMLDTDAGARHLGEFAIGSNKGIDRFTGQILFDEKINGTVHMAVGKSYPETGAVNQSAIHWDMICDMRDGGEILVDGTRFYENGKFLIG